MKKYFPGEIKYWVNKNVSDSCGFDPSLAPFEMDFKETQSSVDGKQANYDNEVVVVFEVGHLQSVFPTFAPPPQFYFPISFHVGAPPLNVCKSIIGTPLC